MITQKRGQKVNTHIALVKKWLADPKSVTKAELKANYKSARAAADAAWDAWDARDAAARAAWDAADAASDAAEAARDAFLQ